MLNRKQNNIKTFSVIALILMIFAQTNILSTFFDSNNPVTYDMNRIFKNLGFYSDNNDNSNIINTPKIATDISPISINGNDELATFVSNEGLTGEGTYESPYIIENYSIDASSEHGIYISNTDAHLIIQNCSIEGGKPAEKNGIHLNNVLNVKICDNYISNNDHGICLYECSNNSLIGNNAINNSRGIKLIESSTNNILSGNYACYNEWGIISSENSNNNTILENTANYNKYNGILIVRSDYINILKNNASYNIFEDSDWTIFEGGIKMFGHCNNVTISENIVSYNSKWGILLSDGCTYNTIFKNIVSNNSQYGIKMDQTSHNLIYFNDIYGNQEAQAYEELTNGDQWDNGTLGNYWGDYTVKYPDSKNDGTFWDTPYEIDGDDYGKDNYPLVHPIKDYEPPVSPKISGFPFINILFFFSVGAFLLRRRITQRRFIS